MNTKLVIMAFFFVLFSSIAQNKKGFNIHNATIPQAEIKDGGPPKDGIPSIDFPKFINAQEASLENLDRVLGISLNGIAKAYPINILNYHEIVNDYLAKQPVVITYCPLCGSGLAFDAMINNKPTTFGVSGLLYNSDVLLYDRETQSLWSQLKYQAVSGALVGTPLQIIPTEITTWENWKNLYPKTLVLSEETGYYRNYAKNPYPRYEFSSDLYFSVSNTDHRFHAKETIIGIDIAGKFKAYPFSELEKLKGKILEDTLEEKPIKVKYSSTHKSAVITDSDNNLLPSVTSFWFAWFAFHPDTEVYLFDK